MTTARHTASSILRARILALLRREGVTSRVLAARLGVLEGSLSRKLSLSAAEDQRRPLRLEELDCIAMVLGFPPDTLLLPVLLPGDRDALRWLVGDQRTPTEADFASVFSDPAARLARLVQQGLVDHDEATGAITITNLGAQAASCA